MKKKLKVCAISPYADYALTSCNSLRIFSLEDSYIYGKIGPTTTILTDVLVTIPKGYIGLLCASPKLISENIQLVGGVQILDSFTNNGVWEIRPCFTQLNSNLSLLCPQHTHIATLYLVKQKKIKF